MEPRYWSIPRGDQMENKEFIQNYLEEAARVARAISVEEIDRAVEILFEAWRHGNQVFTCGNGGSASTATHFASDLTKSTIVAGKKRFRAECLNDNVPLMLALINDDGFENLFYEQLKPKFQTGDVLIAISVHGGAGKDKAGLWSQNLLKAMKYAKDTGGKTIGFSGFDGGPMKDIADACIIVPANSTPHVESFHLTLEHLICDCLKQKIGDYEREGSLS
jgi:D-sedoheptulose 7-phosphate isomerase